MENALGECSKDIVDYSESNKDFVNFTFCLLLRKCQGKLTKEYYLSNNIRYLVNADNLPFQYQF